MTKASDDPDAILPVVEERLTVGKRQVETGRVSVRVLTEQEDVNAEASLIDQQVEVQRVPIGREVTEMPTVRQDGDVTIIPVLEEILVVEKRLVLLEEVHVRRVVTRQDVTQPVTLRRQRVEVVRTAIPTDDDSKE